MDKNSIKRYATWARRELIERVAQRAMLYGINDDAAGNPDDDSVNNRLLSPTEKRQRQALIRNVKAKGYKQVIEEVAYTWFNRFAALRFMEVNGYLPSHVRIFTNDAGEFKPQILSEAIRLELDGLDKEKVFELVAANKTEELFKYLLIVQCNALNKILPGMFQRIEDYTELLLPDYLLREGSAIEQMISAIPESDWTDQVQIIGWLYQYYNSELKDKVFADLKKNVKISKENIPAATQLFTPDWIVHYMVENSLGRLWLEGHPNKNLQAEWKYYLDEAAQEEAVQIQLEKIRADFAALKPEDIRVIDPCAGSGHILCVLFDVLIRIYEDYGYTAREAAAKIVENNLWGLDIDERAAQLSYFAVMMKARRYDRRFFTRNVKPHICAIHESNAIREDYDGAKFYFHLSQENQAALDYLIDVFADAKEYGSIIQLAPRDYIALQKEWAGVNLDGLFYAPLAAEINFLIEQAIALSQKYNVVVTNPPYMGGSGMGNALANYVKKNFQDTKSDLFAVFIERCGYLTAKNYFQAMITQHSWMFLSSFEKLRAKLQMIDTVNMIHLGARAFEEIGGEVVQTTSFVFRNNHVPKYRGVYVRLIEPNTQTGKEEMFLSGTNRFTTQQDNFSKIPGAPVAYWVSESFLRVFDKAINIGSIATARKGLVTGNDDLYLKLWHEVSKNNFSIFKGWETKWKPCNKGGNFRKWYGNNNYVVNWGIDGTELSNHRWLDGRQRSSLRNSSFFFIEGLTWTYITSASTAFRYYDKGYAFAGVGPGLFVNNPKDMMCVLGYCNSIVFDSILKMIGSSTISLESGEVERAPILPINDKSAIEALVKSCISLSRADWDAFETSWDFKAHPLINRGAVTIKQAFDIWQDEAAARFSKLKANEQELNRIFIEIYGLGDELTPAVDDKDITVRRADFNRDVRSFLSYAVGCMFGRYALGKPGLIYAGGDWNLDNYPHFKPNKHEIIPLSDAEYFDSDIIIRLEEFLTAAFGQATLEENLREIAEALGKNGTPREIIRNYFINDFYADHVKIYKKRPIYWLFDSGKKNGFKCLIYLHRYRPDTVARIRTEYVHEQQARYRMAIETMEKIIKGASTADRVKLSKKLAALQSQAEEIRAYEEKIHHLADRMTKIDLDNGVKHNYELFADVLAKIK